MIRRYHRWLSVVAGIFILWIAGTGTIVQFSRLAAPERPTAEAVEAPTTPAEARLPGTADGPVAAAASGPAETPAPDATAQFIHFMTELHSGEEFGIAGQVIGLLSGLALLFFGVSGVYMYVQMFRGRLVKVKEGKSLRGGKYFWK